MPASPSFPSAVGTGTRGNRWKRRKRDPQAQGTNRRTKDDDEEEEDEEDELVDREEDAAGGDPHLSTPDPNPRETEVLSEGGVRVCSFPPVVKRAVSRPHSSVLAIVAAERAGLSGESRTATGVVLENVSYGQLQALSAVPADSPALVDGEGPTSFVVQPPQLMEGSGVVKRYGSRVHVVPMHSDWFSPASVHRVERQVVPHLFSGKSADNSPEKYMECRNYIVAKYMENPDTRLTVSDCQGLVGGIQYEDLTRIFRFLDHWGIINYCAATQEPEPSFEVSYLKEDAQGEIVVPSAALKSIDSLIRFDKPRCRLKAADVYSSSSTKEDDVLDLDSKIREQLSECHCNHCSRPLLTMYYQSQKEVEVYLCKDCFHEGKFVIGHSNIDFARVDSTKGYDDLDGDSWTDQETLLLLEAMELYNDNWNEIAERVGTKTKAECIHHFLRLPVEDGLLENIEVSGVNTSSNLSNGGNHKSSYSTSNCNLEGSHREDDDSENRLPFTNSENPVMSLVAFLASKIAPRVAAACAQAALAALAEDCSMESGNIKQVEEIAQGHSMNSEGGLAEDSDQQKGVPNDVGPTPISAENVKAAARVGLAAAATKAKLFADHEEREIQRLSANIINQQLKRLELKLKQFAEVETLLMRECEQVEKTRQRFASERARVISSRFGPAGPTGPLGSTMSQSPNPQSPMTPPLRPGMMNSGYGQQMGQQQAHSPMPFMPRQQMGFSLGPRLPLSAINSSSSNAVFNSPGNNPQPPSGLNHSMLRSGSGAGSNLG